MKSKKFFDGLGFKVIGPVILTFLLTFCDMGERTLPQPVATDQNVKSKFEPVLVSLSPAAAFICPEPFELTATGENFGPDSTIVVNGIDLETEYVSEEKLKCQVNFDNLKQALAMDQEESTYVFYDVWVKNDNIHLSQPLKWPLRRLEFDIDGSRLLFDDQTEYVKVDMEMDAKNNIYVAREKFSQVGPYFGDDGPAVAKISIVSSFDKGLTWTKPKVVQSKIKSYYWTNWKYDEFTGNFDMAVDDFGNIFVAYDEDTETGYSDDSTPQHIYLIKSTDHGKTWARQTLAENNNDLSLKQVMIKANNIFVLYSKSGTYMFDEKTLLLSSSDQGQSWRILLEVNASQAMLAYDENNKKLHLFYDSYCFVSSTDFGKTWSNPIDFPNFPIDCSSAKQIVFGADSLWHFIFNYSLNYYQFYYYNTLNYGLTWQGGRKVTSRSMTMDGYGLLYGYGFENNNDYLYLANADGLKWYSHNFGSYKVFGYLIKMDQENNIHLVNGGGWQGKIYYARIRVR